MNSATKVRVFHFIFQLKLNFDEIFLYFLPNEVSNDIGFS